MTCKMSSLRDMCIGRGHIYLLFSAICVALSFIPLGSAAEEADGGSKAPDPTDTIVMPDELGGISAISIDGRGTTAVLLSDRGRIITLRLHRRIDQSIAELSIVAAHPLLGQDEKPLPKHLADAEGIAPLPRGRFAVSFEGEHRIDAYTRDGRRIGPIAAPDILRRTPINRGIEALAAIDDRHLLWCIEESGECYILDGATSRLAFRSSRGDGYRVTGADAHPSGGVVILERRVSILGFSARLRHVSLDDRGAAEERTLKEWSWGEVGNLEGVALWVDRSGALRAILVEDNNFSRLQRNRLLELTLGKARAP